MFEKFDPREGKKLEIMNENGEITPINEIPLMNDSQILEGYLVMLKTRVADEWAISLQRQGRMPTFPPTKGQEAIPLGALMALNQDDWFVIAYRELSGWLYRGIPLRNWYGYYYGNEKYAHLPTNKYHTFPPSVPIASQLLHTSGLAYAEKFKKTGRLAIGFVGDGGTSEGDFHEALNFAAVWKAGAIFIIQNNHYAISCPREKQTITPTLAEKGFAYGIPSIQVDGNDILSVYGAVKMAAERGRNGLGPTLIEAVTYRLGPHTTADDPTLYRSEEEVELWKPKDPLIRTEKYLLSKELLTSEKIEALKEEFLAFAKEEFQSVETSEDPTIEETYNYHYKELPEIMKEQLKERKERK
ncbi:thiamine pyrophosphate-dependent dehydrogenase E1 component subunit alpha [bacterium]|nr:thiamine pyrophosphate-dependent dehydrogenase E1 component subunit alpha [bacterium]